ncbi:hypothetical protein BaRGS_00002101 [Batillaria attramentaria]|uniref:Uncharacterized protein n=1 Tax=Batillaria attramentaria TaxID=370345 RepID=A0ABD0M5I0_9CAEN
MAASPKQNVEWWQFSGQPKTLLPNRTLGGTQSMASFQWLLCYHFSGPSKTPLSTPERSAPSVSPFQWLLNDTISVAPQWRHFSSPSMTPLPTSKAQ